MELKIFNFLLNQTATIKIHKVQTPQLNACILSQEPNKDKFHVEQPLRMLNTKHIPCHHS